MIDANDVEGHAGKCYIINNFDPAGKVLMTKVVVEKLSSVKSGRSSAVASKQFRDATSGRFVTVRTIDANSATFGDDLQNVFAKNVKKARKENRANFGSADRVAARKK